ncbi:MAG: hypothetical protein B7X34_06415 [Acidobacteriia bacterium 12-62-4]|nr:MAG: hypothetical protein B7X34_06415 [Acidobacteriia bacterium 12-62-4]
MRRVAVAFALCALLQAATVSRVSLAAVEDVYNRRLKTLVPGEPFLLLGETHGVYLENYGAVFTANVLLAEGPTENPFRKSVSAKEQADLRQRKLERLPKLRSLMREALVVSAGMLDTVPANEQIAISVVLLRYPYEDASSGPSQIMMQATRSALVNLQVNPPSDQAVFLKTIRTREY